ncbi:uncharacterized protein LOC126398707 isoform X3 [Epinephelus moara]|uniref:uncharacterized protein LOC126398707 isoform X3 n=1 Tax=Epinephelus moara TaxID=300413 RepID=UPI00214F58E3|nr:uncharacterized protein LOC126398707 isoform X3 [Epinephelus moara]
MYSLDNFDRLEVTGAISQIFFQLGHHREEVPSSPVIQLCTRHNRQRMARLGLILIFMLQFEVSPSQPDADPKRDGEVTLECSLSRYSDLGPCPQNSVHWVNETGAVLSGEGVGYKFLRQTECVSALTVKHQSGNNRKYTCQFVDNNKVEIEADYTPDFTDPTSFNQTYIIIGAVVGTVVVLVVIAAALIKYKRRAKVTEDVHKPTQHPGEPESSLTYVTVNHANQRASPHKKVKTEEVTYSTVKY